jgi:hypothetical protein
MTDDNIDVIALQMQIEEMVRAEYKDSLALVEKLKREHEDRSAGWSAIVNRVKDHYSGPLTLADNSHLDDFLQRLDVIVGLGLDFETLLKAMQSNEILKKQWDSMCMTMRLTGMDNSASGGENE